MGQIFNRFFKIAKSYIDDVGSHIQLQQDEDEELKKIIADLEKDRDKKNNKSEFNSNNNTSISVDDALNTFKLSRSANWDEVKAAYKQKMKEYHPDKVMNLGEELKELAARKTKEFNKSYEILKDYYSKTGKL